MAFSHGSCRINDVIGGGVAKAWAAALPTRAPMVSEDQGRYHASRLARRPVCNPFIPSGVTAKKMGLKWTLGEEWGQPQGTRQLTGFEVFPAFGPTSRGFGPPH